MATREIITLICDLCLREGDDVATHQLTVNGHAVELEACSRCWGKADKALTPLLEAGRKVKRQRAA